MRLLFALALIVLTAGHAAACAICLSAVSVTVGQKLDAADQVVLATPLPDGQRFRVVAVVKGDAGFNRLIAEPVYLDDTAAPQRGEPLLLLRNALGQRWESIGSIDVEHAGWLRRLAATSGARRATPRPVWPRTAQTGFSLSEDEWRERLALVVPYLEHPEPLAAAIAYGEISRAPYRAIQSLKPKLEAARIAQWLEDPKLASRQATYALLMGIVGGPDDAARLERRLDAAWQAHDTTNLAAMLAADLELRGPAQVGFIERMYLTDRDRSMPEVEAALLALSVHGGADAAVSRARVIKAYRLLIRERPPMAGFVAQELADWGYWDVTSDYAALLKADAIKDPASHFAVVNYLQRSPHVDAAAALRSLSEQPR